MKTKICPRCEIEKSIKEFYPRKDRPGQYSSWCRPCMKWNSTRYGDSPRGREVMAKYRKSNARKESLSRYNVSEKRYEVSRRYYETGAPQRYDEKRKQDPLYLIKKCAKAVARKLLLDGKITLSECEYEHLGNCHGRLEMHHDDYSKPEQVRILCCRHHKYVDLGSLD